MLPLGLVLIVGSGAVLLGSGGRKKTSTKPSSLPYVRGIGRTSPEFRVKSAKIAASLGADPLDLLLCMSFETAGTFDPAERNPISNAIGLIQFMPSTASHMLNTSTEELSQMSAIDQLDFVEKYLRRIGSRFPRLEDLYMAILSPNAVGKPREYILFRDPGVAYRQNRGLDTNDDGAITVAEATDRVRQMRTRPTMNLLLVGDSIAEGIGQQLAPIARAASVHLTINTVRGSTFTHWVNDNKLQLIVNRLRPSHVMIELGTNDVANKADPEWQRYAIERMVQWTRAVKAEPIWLGLPLLPFPSAAALRAVIVDECDHRKVRLFSATSTTYERAPDRIHFTPKGYKQLATGIAAWLPLSENR